MVSFLLLAFEPIKSQPSILSSTSTAFASGFSSTVNSGSTARQAQTPKSSQAESGRWSHRAGRASHATFHDPSPFRSQRSIEFCRSRKSPLLRHGVIACHMEAAPPPATKEPPSLQSVEWWRLRRWSPSTKCIGLWSNRVLWWAAEPWKKEYESEVRIQGLGRAHSAASITIL